jgi:cytoskeleton protein RodZ
MSETEAPVAPEGPSAGTLLRQAREAAGLHVSTLAANLKVPVRKLEALEEDRYEELPDAVFVRALASSVCRTLKVDAAPVLQRLPQTPQPRLAHGGERINAPFRSPSDGPAPGLMNQVSRPVVLVVVALLLGALVLILLPLAQRNPVTGTGSDKAQVRTPSATEAARPEQPTTAAANAASAVDAGLPAAPASAAGAVPTAAAVTQGPEVAGSAPAGMQLRTSPGTAPAAASPAPATAASTAAPAAATPTAAASAAPVDAQGIVVFRARAQSWVQVKDARGATVMQKLLKAGESAGATGALPLSVTVGSAQSTDVQVRGQAFDIAPLAHDNVARFQVK